MDLVSESTPMAREHDVIRAEIPNLTAFLSYRRNQIMNPVIFAAIERIVAAWRAAEPT